MNEKNTGADLKSATDGGDKKLYIETYGCQMNVDCLSDENGGL